MDLENKNIGFVLTGSFCTFSKVIPKMKELVAEGANVIPIMSYNAYELDTKFGKAADFIKEIEEITGNKIIHTIQDAEPIGPKKLTDIMIVAPASRKHYGKACKRYNRYTSVNGNKISFEKQQSSCYCYFNKQCFKPEMQKT